MSIRRSCAVFSCRAAHCFLRTSLGNNGAAQGLAEHSRGRLTSNRRVFISRKLDEVLGSTETDSGATVLRASHHFYPVLACPDKAQDVANATACFQQEPQPLEVVQQVGRLRISRPHSTQLHGAANISWTGPWWLENRGPARTTNSPRFAPQTPSAETEKLAAFPQTVATATPHCLMSSRMIAGVIWTPVMGHLAFSGANGVVRRIRALQTVAVQNDCPSSAPGGSKEVQPGRYAAEQGWCCYSKRCIQRV